MIIKSNIRGGYRSAAQYMKEQGKNEKTRLVELSDPEAKNLDDAFQNMWVVAATTKCRKPLHHISINPMKDERLTDAQVLKIVERCEEKYGYKMFHHQRVIVEHTLDGRQHFHVVWNRVSLMTGKPVWPGLHWNKSKEVCREMEKELGLKSPMPRARSKRARSVRSNNLVRSKPNFTRAVKRSGKVKHTHTIKPLRQHVSPYSDAAVLSMLNRVQRYVDALHAQQPVAYRPERQGGWPPAAIHAWQTWGHKFPRDFFARWPELAR